MSEYQDLYTAPSVPLPETADEDRRVGHLLGRDLESAKVVLLGFPSDEGVRVNGGRVGASEGPDAIRRWLYRLTPDARRHEAFTRLLGRTVDLGDFRIDAGASLAERQAAFGAALAGHLSAGRTAVVLGGGHETAFAHFMGYVRAEQPVGILNWDAHADVRPLKDGQPHSGSPFRQALEHPSGLCRGYTVAGLQPHSTARAHVDYVASQGGRYLWRDALTRARVNALYGALDAPHLVTFDLDAVDQAYAPGVSAPATGGLSPDLWLHAAYRAGRCPQVASIDVVELNPRYDADAQTARLAALTVWHFLRGFLERA